MFDALERTRDGLSDLVAALDPDTFDGPRAARAVEGFAAVERLAAAGKTLMARRVEETNAWRADGDRSAAHWVARQTGTTVGQAVATLETGRRLDDCPETEAALRSGALSTMEASEISAAASADPSQELDLLESARTNGVVGLRTDCRRVKAAASAADAIERYEEIRRARSFRHWTDDTGTFRAAIACTPDAGARLLARMQPHVDAAFRDARQAARRESHDAYAFDGLLCMAESSGGDAVSGPTAMVHVNVDHTAYVRGHVETGETCELPGIGPIPVATARAIAGDAILIGILKKGSDVVAVANLGRTIPAKLRRALEARDPECVVPGCNVRDHLQIDHRVPVADGGETSLANTNRLCSWHHYLKTHHGYLLDGEPGNWRWRAPPLPVAA